MALPQTPFEARGHTGAWTTLDQERAYFADLLAEAPGITQEHIGYGAGGADMFLYRFGAGDRTILFVAQQHGAELAGREAMLTRIRDWATSDDPSIQDYLERVTVLVIPTAHPDNTSTRNNPNGINVNREHVRVQEPEAVAIHAVIRDHQPEVIADLHEAINGVSSNVMTSYMTNPNIHPGLADLSLELEHQIRDMVHGRGDTWEPYWGHRITAPDYLNNGAGFRHAVGLLVETRRYQSDNTDSGDRYQRQLWCVDLVRQWHDDHMERIGRACQASRDYAAAPQGWVELITGEDTSVATISPAPDGYLITTAGREDLQNPEELFGLDIATVDEGLYLNARHPARWAIHHLVDPVIPDRLATGVRQPEESEPVDPPVPIPGVAGWRFRTGGVIYEAHPRGIVGHVYQS